LLTLILVQGSMKLNTVQGAQQQNGRPNRKEMRRDNKRNAAQDALREVRRKFRGLACQKSTVSLRQEAGARGYSDIDSEPETGSISPA
jgi:hypothetical protein